MESVSCTITQDEVDSKFFGAIGRELSLKSPQKIITLVKLLVSHLRRSLSQQHADEMVFKIPPPLQKICMDNLTKKEPVSSITHSDKLVDTIYQQDQSNEEKFFFSEIHALSAVIIVLKYMNKFFPAFGLHCFSYPLVKNTNSSTGRNCINFSSNK